MIDAIHEIDHVLTYVESIEAAETVYRAMGFTLTPPSHITAMGIVNQVILLHSRTASAANFIELMGVTDQALLPRPMRDALSGPNGVKSMVMTTDDAAQAQIELVRAGYPFDPPHHVRREWVLPGEGSVWPEFDVLLPISTALPFNVCQYHDLSLYQRDSWRTHRNSAVCLMGCFAITNDPSRSVEEFETLFGRAAIRAGDGGLAVSPGKTEIIMYSRAAFAAAFGVKIDDPRPQHYAGFRIGVSNMITLRSCLDDSNIEYRYDNSRIVVYTGFSCGNIIEFVPI